MTISSFIDPSVDVNQRISENATTLMFRLGWTQRDLARAIGVGDNTIGRRLKGARDWTATELVAIAAATHVSVEQLLGTLPDYETWCAIKGSNLGPTDMESVQVSDALIIEFPVFRSA